ncbi:MAG: hypothetical protein LUD15_06845 [Bacteroides sp.]|nr:hypothetical protein [Bacteroides sp.]
MKKQSLLICAAGIVLSSCLSGKAIQKEIREYRSNLFYELSTPLYPDTALTRVHLKFIDCSNMDYYTGVREKGTIILLLLLYMYDKHRFKSRLGEASVYPTYREFLTEALLTECNSSTCLHLVEEGQTPPSDPSAYTMEVKIINNQTYAITTTGSHSVIWFEWEYLTFEKHRLKQVETDLSIRITIARGEETLHDKVYSRKWMQSLYDRNYPDRQKLNRICVEYMAEPLSRCTKELVEDIATELHLLFTGFMYKEKLYKERSRL